MKDQTELIGGQNIATLIRFIRGARVILDTDLAKVYGVETRALNQALKRNQQRFPADFAFELTREEILGISQTVISLGNLKFSKQVRAFTEHGALHVKEEGVAYRVKGRSRLLRRRRSF